MLRCCTPVMGLSKAPAVYLSHMRCSVVHFPTFWKFGFRYLKYLSHLFFYFQLTRYVRCVCVCMLCVVFDCIMLSVYLCE